MELHSSVTLKTERLESQIIQSCGINTTRGFTKDSRNRLAHLYLRENNLSFINICIIREL